MDARADFFMCVALYSNTTRDIYITFLQNYCKNLLTMKTATRTNKKISMIFVPGCAACTRWAPGIAKDFIGAQ
jgi:hypothetical protein